MIIKGDLIKLWQTAFSFKKKSLEIEFKEKAQTHISVLFNTGFYCR